MNNLPGWIVVAPVSKHVERRQIRASSISLVDQIRGDAPTSAKTEIVLRCGTQVELADEYEVVLARICVADAEVSASLSQSPRGPGGA